MYVRGTLLRILAVGFASSFEPDFPGDSSESSCFFIWAGPFGVFMTETGEKMGGEEETVRVIYQAWAGPHSSVVWCDEGTGRIRQGIPLPVSK